MPEDNTARRRGRPPDPGLRTRVLDAVAIELAEAGVGGFSVNAVSARAGVAKRSISARWPDRASLILDGMDHLAAGLVPPHTGALRRDLEVLAAQIAEVLTEPRRSVLARCAAELHSYPEYAARFRRESVDRCMAAVQDAIEDARRRGDLRAGVDPATVAEGFVSALVGSASLGAGTLVDRAAGWIDVLVLGAGVHTDGEKPRQSREFR